MIGPGAEATVLVHGYLGGSAQWHLQRPALESLGPVVAVDLPGFGENAALEAPDSIAGFATWVLEHLSERGVERFHLLGHSMGGMIVQQMTAQAPARVDKLVLYGTGCHGNMPGRFETLDATAERAARDGVEATANRVSATWFLHGEADPEYPGCAAIARQSTAQSQLAGLMAMKGWSGAAHLADIGSRTLVLWGEADRAYPWAQVEELWRTVPDSHLAVLPGCSHAVHLERAPLFNTILTEFLDDNA
ncbi:MAG: alpha/beta fold hydrolase [Pseudomonadota bacterium]